MENIRVAICDDMDSVCEGYRMYIEREKDMECIGIANSSADCLKLVENMHPDVLLLDIYIENEMSGITLLPKVKAISPDTKVVMMTSYSNSQYVFHALMNGADEYVVKDTDGRKIITKIRDVYHKTPDDDNKVMEEFKNEVRQLYASRQSLFYFINMLVKLSQSEFEILHDIYDGMTYKQIAEKRFVEECTIKTHASRILKKFEANSMKELISDIRKQKLFEQL